LALPACEAHRVTPIELVVDQRLWSRIPAGLKARPQWVLAGADKVPLTLDDFGKLRATSATRPSEWMSFDAAALAAWERAAAVTTHVTKEGVTVRKTGYDLGFVLHEADPYSCIDLDVKDSVTHPTKPELWTTPDDFQRFVSIINTFTSYTEKSRSGKGIHVWVQGNIGRGFKRDGVEVYSQERYIICTGDVYVDQPICERENILANMIARMRPVESDLALEELEPQWDDWYVFQVAALAANHDKFWALWEGRWSDLGYPSQSEADLALMSMFTFYSDSNEQCRRLFRQSKLGQREKTTKNNYHVNKLLKLIRERQARESGVELSAIMKAADNVASLRAAVEAAQGGVAAASDSREVVQLSQPGQGDPVQPPPPPASAVAQLHPVPEQVRAEGESGVPWPPGFVGSLAQFIYENSWRPIKEVSIVAALGMLAGLAGKAWHIPQSGLNLYIVLVARSAIGKEAMHTGISTLVSHCQARCRWFGNFVDFTEYVSGPALVKACLTNNSFVNVSGEWGKRLRRMAADDGRDGPMNSLRTQMTNLYQKSGPQSIAGGLSYSAAENNVASVQGVAYSMIGESTPGNFYEALTESMMEDGFLSRFLIVGYDGDRPDRNPAMLEVPDDALVQALVDIATQAHAQINKQSSQPLGRTEEAAAIMAEFDAEAHTRITATDDESRRQMWNRASLKALRVAALLAVGDHYLAPSITADHMRWAIDLIRRDIAMMQKRLEGGDVGSGDRARERKLVTIIREYIQAARIPKSYRVPEKMHKDGLVPRSYLQTRTQQVASFYNHKLGANRALEDAITSCVANGWLMECKGTAVVDGYGHHGKTYRILDLPDYTQGDKT
jgi:hypothetical protein